MPIQDIFIKYSSQLDHLDLELLIAHELKKSREFVLAHPEYKIPSLKIENLKLKISRRRRGEPLAYILGHKEFCGLDFKVDRNTLIPRPETELLVELALQELKTINYKLKTSVIDIGTGSGNIIISIASQLKNYESGIKNYEFFGIDISDKTLEIAKQNAKKHGVDKKINPAPSCKSLNLLKNIHSHHSQKTTTPPRRCGINFLKGSLLNPLIENLPAGRQGCKLKIENSKIIILANLPYLSKKIYMAADISVKKFEPRSALLSKNHGLAHYEKLLKQIKKLRVTRYAFCVFMEISPEQKPRLAKIIKKYLPAAKITFHRDLARKWRVCQIET